MAALEEIRGAASASVEAVVEELLSVSSLGRYSVQISINDTNSP